MSYVLLLTAFYIDNGPHLPLWNKLPLPRFGCCLRQPGVPLIVRALLRHPLMVSTRLQ
jgi:hypothetical protein